MRDLHIPHSSRALDFLVGGDFSPKLCRKIHQNSDNSSDESLVAYIGLTEPEINVRWVKMNIDEGWGEILIACRELLEAGYPGCIGCGGPNSELPWNEAKNRANLP